MKRNHFLRKCRLSNDQERARVKGKGKHVNQEKGLPGDSKKLRFRPFKKMPW